MTDHISPTICEVCGYDASKTDKFSPIVRHHWNGYDHPTDIWWVCRSCNSKLAGKHDGSLSIQQARVYIQSCGMFTDIEKYEAECAAFHKRAENLGLSENTLAMIEMFLGKQEEDYSI